MSYSDVNVEPTVEAVASIVVCSGNHLPKQGCTVSTTKVSVVAFVMNIV